MILITTAISESDSSKVCDITITEIADVRIITQTEKITFRHGLKKEERELKTGKYTIRFTSILKQYLTISDLTEEEKENIMQELYKNGKIDLRSNTYAYYWNKIAEE